MLCIGYNTLCWVLSLNSPVVKFSLSSCFVQNSDPFVEVFALLFLYDMSIEVHWGIDVPNRTFNIRYNITSIEYDLLCRLKSLPIGRLWYELTEHQTKEILILLEETQFSLNNVKTKNQKREQNESKLANAMYWI